MTAVSRTPAPKHDQKLNDLRNIVRALEGRAPAMLAESSAKYQVASTPTDLSQMQMQTQTPVHRARLGFDVEALDSTLGGGLVGDALHEVFPKRPEWDDGLTSAFALSLLSQLQASDLGHAISPSTGARTPRPIVWITQRDTAGATLSPQGLMALGFNPDALFQIEANNDADALWAFEEVLNHAELGAAVVEVCNLDLAQSHRIQLRAQETQLRKRFRLLMMLRRNKGARQPQVAPTSAATRWRLGPVPPQKLAVQDGEVPRPISLEAHKGLTPSANLVARDHSTNNVGHGKGKGTIGTSTSQVTSLIPRMNSAPLSRVRWSAELFRQRGGAPGNWFLEWSYEAAQFRQLVEAAQ